MKRLFVLLAGLVAGLAVAAPASADLILAPGANWEYTFADPTGDADWATTGLWSESSFGDAPFGNCPDAGCAGYPTEFDFNTEWPADGSDGDDLWVRRTFDTTGFILSSILWDLGVDNGFTLYLNGNLIASANAEGYTYRWEYSGDFGGFLQPGENILAVALEDHGGLTAFDMQVTGDPVPEPATLMLLGGGLAGLALRRRRRA